MRNVDETRLIADILVSVVIPTFNRPEKVARALQSVVSQSHSNLEIIVVDDNLEKSDASRRTREYVEPFSRYMPLTVVGTGGAKGGGAARNLGCRNAKGEYLAFLDDDDIFLPHKIAAQLAFMVVNELEVSYQDVAWYSDAGRLIENRKLDHARDHSKEHLLRAHLKIPISPTAIYMVRRESFNKTGGFGEVLTGQDWFLMLRCIELGLRIGYQPETHVHQILHDGPRLSLGANKIAGEKHRHEVVRSYYDLLTKKEIRFIEFRHYAVLAVSAARSRDRLASIRYLLKALSLSPSAFVSEGIKLMHSRKKR